MLRFKQKKQLKIRKQTRLGLLMARPLVRFTAAVVVALFATIVLFIFMDYLMGDFDQYALRTAEDLFYIQRVVIQEEPADELDASDLVTTPVPSRPPDLGAILEMMEDNDDPAATKDTPVTDPPAAGVPAGGVNAD